MAKYLFLLNTKYGKIGRMYKINSVKFNDYQVAKNQFYGHKEANFSSLYEKEISEKNEFDIYVEPFVAFNQLDKFKPKLTFKGTLKELDDFILANDEKYHFYHNESKIRTLLISIHTGDWYIKSGVCGDYPDEYPIFANLNVSDGKIWFIHDYMIFDRIIQRAKDIGKAFLEECIFTYEDTSFRGNFIDAFEFIKKELNKKGEKYISKDNLYSSGDILNEEFPFIDTVDETYTLYPFMDLRDVVKNDDEIVAASIDNKGINILILHFASSYKDKEGYFKKFYSKEKLKNYTFIRYDLNKKQLFKFFLKDEVFIYMNVNSLPNNEILFTCPHCTYYEDIEFNNNAKLYNSSGKLIRDFQLGYSISDIKIDLKGNIWTTYFDNGILFGNCGKDLSGLECWDTHGKILWSFRTKDENKILDECYAFTIDNENNIWFYYYTYFPIARLNDKKQIKFWDPNLEGAESLHVYKDNIMMNANYSHSDDVYDIYILFKYKKDDIEKVKSIRFKSEDNFKFCFDTSIPSVGSHIGFLHENKIYLTNMKKVVENG